MDPLSVAASIVGIIAAAGKVAAMVQPFVSSTQDAPKLALSIYSEVNRVRIVLSSLETILSDLASPSTTTASRASFIDIDHVIVLFTDGVLLFSELETLLAPLKSSSDAQFALKQRFLWVSKEKAISLVVNRIQGFLSSLSALLNIFQCRSDLEASESRRAVQTQIATLLDSNIALAAKVRELEDAFNATANVGESVMNDAVQLSGGADNSRLSTTSNASVMRSSSGYWFQNDLNSSRVYRRAQRTESYMSFSSSALGSAAWSIFSGFSLAEVSILSVIALPLCATDIQNTEHYNFGDRQKEDSQSSNSDDWSLYYECITLKSMLMQLPGMASLLSKHEDEQSGAEGLFGGLLLDGTFFKMLYLAISKRPLETAFVYHGAWRDAEVRAAYRFMLECSRLWGIEAPECFTMTDIREFPSSRMRKTIRLLMYLIDKFSDQIDTQPRVDGRQQMYKDDQGILGPKNAVSLLREFLREERTYVNSLQTLQVLHEGIEAAKGLKLGFVRDFLAALQETCDLHTRFLYRLESRKKDLLKDDLLANAFLAEADSFQVHSFYIAHQNRIEGLADQLDLEDVKDAATVIDPSVKRMIEDKAVLKEHLISLIARPSYYVKFLELMILQCWEDQHNLVMQKARLIFKDTIVAGDRESTRLAAVNDLSDRVIDWKNLHLDQLGELLLYDRYNVSRVAANYDVKERMYSLYLFENIILFCYERSIDAHSLSKDSGQPNYQQWVVRPPRRLKIKGRIHMSNVKEVTLFGAESLTSMRLSYQGDKEMEAVVVRFPRPDLAHDWLETIQDQLRKAGLRRRRDCLIQTSEHNELQN